MPPLDPIRTESLLQAAGSSPTVAHMLALSFADRDLELIEFLKSTDDLPAAGDFPPPQTLVAALGVLFIVFAIREGSFSAGGAVVDNKLVQATSGVAPAIDSAASKTGTAMETAGQNLKDQGAAIAGKPDSSAP